MEAARYDPSRERLIRREPAILHALLEKQMTSEESRASWLLIDEATLLALLEVHPGARPLRARLRTYADACSLVPAR